MRISKPRTGEPIELQVRLARRRDYYRGKLPEAMNGFQAFVLRSEGDANLLPFLPFAQFSLERCEERLGLGERGIQQDVVTGAHGEKNVVVKLGTGQLSNVVVTGPQMERFFILLDKGGVKLDATPSRSSRERCSRSRARSADHSGRRRPRPRPLVRMAPSVRNGCSPRAASIRSRSACRSCRAEARTRDALRRDPDGGDRAADPRS
jgi:hypothetical protein